MLLFLVCVCVCVCLSFWVMSNSATPWAVARQSPLPMDSPAKNTGEGCHSLLPFPLFSWESLAGTMESIVVPHHPCPKLLSTPQNNFFGPREDRGEVCLILCLKPGFLKNPRRESLLIQWNSCGRISATTFYLQQNDFSFFFFFAVSVLSTF